MDGVLQTDVFGSVFGNAFCVLSQVLGIDGPPTRGARYGYLLKLGASGPVAPKAERIDSSIAQAVCRCKLLWRLSEAVVSRFASPKKRTVRRG